MNLSSETARIFIALTLPNAVQQHCVRLIGMLRSGINTGVRWEVGDKIHVTLRFLGDMPVAALPQITDCLNTLPEKRAPVLLRLAALGAFPNWHSPNVLWLGIEPNAALDQLQSDLEQRLVGIGIPKDKRNFHPHLTLGRVNRNCPSEVIRQVQLTCQQADLRPYDAFHARHVVLFQSTLQRSGAIYQALHTIDLNKSK